MNELPNSKILFVITKSNWGGAQAYVYTLATHLKSAGVEVAVALGGTGAAGATAGLLADKLASSGIRTIFLKTFARDISILREVKAFIELRRVIREERPDVLHLNSSKAGGIGAFAGRLAGIQKIVFTSHGLAYDEDRSFLTRVFRWFATWATFALSHRIILISKDTYRRARYFPFCRNKMHLVYNGIAPEPVLDRLTARARLLPHLVSGRVWIGTIAELTPNKALDSLVNAAALLRKNGHLFTLCIISDGEERLTLERLIARENLSEYVHLIGFLPHAAQYLRAFDIFTLTSTKEGLPYVLLEAAQAECAVVGTRIPGITDIIDAETGILVEPKNVSEIASSLETLIVNEPKRLALGKALRKKVSENFSIEQMLKKTGEVYRSRRDFLSGTPP
ncbi:MAG: glycosyltransferase [bacterium]|nr:glycosyltransferase [bacterium]